jgi:hypothetical protein
MTPEDVRAALSQLRADYEGIARLLAQLGNQEGIQLATECAETLRQMSDDISRIRNRIITDIWESEKLSLANLAERVGISKTRADQIIRTAKAAKNDKETGNG